MRTVIQRVSRAAVDISGSPVAEVGTGLLVLIGIAGGDTEQDAEYLAEKIAGLRIFPDDEGKMNRNVREAGGALLVVSQFTLCGDCRRGRRPSFDRAAPPEKALELYNYLVSILRRTGTTVETGVFQAHMDVSLVNHGPVTIWIDSAERVRK